MNTLLSAPSFACYFIRRYSNMLNCFCAAGGNRLEIDDDRPQPARSPTSTAKKSRMLSRQGSDTSQISSSSSKSIDSISRLPPCKRTSDPKIEAMMMPLPHDPRPSRCLRLSHPKIYSNLVSDMKSSKGCRDWKNFPVFYNDDIDINTSADEFARKKALDYERKLRQLNASFSSGGETDRSISVDMIG